VAAMPDLAIPLGEKPGNSATFGFDLSPCGAAGITSIGTWPASTSRSLSASWRARVVRPSSTSWNSSWTATPCGGPEPQALPNTCQISISLFLVPYSAWLARLRLILSPKLQGESGQPGLGSFRPNPIANPSKRGAFRAIFNWTRQMGVVTGRRLRCLDVPCDGCCEVRASLRRAGAASREFFERQPALMGELWTHYLHLRKTGALADPPVEVWPFADARQVLQAVEHRRSLGKNVLSRRT